MSSLYTYTINILIKVYFTSFSYTKEEPDGLAITSYVMLQLDYVIFTRWYIRVNTSRMFPLYMPTFSYVGELASYMRMHLRCLRMIRSVSTVRGLFVPPPGPGAWSPVGGRFNAQGRHMLYILCIIHCIYMYGTSLCVFCVHVFVDLLTYIRTCLHAYLEYV
jgi:hypothetical protein